LAETMDTEGTGRVVAARALTAKSEGQKISMPAFAARARGVKGTRARD
jgi:hypothetical protein